jgi:hypothetical protein
VTGDVKADNEVKGIDRELALRLPRDTPVRRGGSSSLSSTQKDPRVYVDWIGDRQMDGSHVSAKAAEVTREGTRVRFEGSSMSHQAVE